MRTSEVLNTAADLIEERGWHQGGYSADGGWRDSSSALCLLGAINCAAGRMEIPAGTVVCEYVDGSVIEWNDAPERTSTEVIEVLRACALIESAREEQDAVWQTYATNVARA